MARAAFALLCLALVCGTAVQGWNHPQHEQPPPPQVTKSVKSTKTVNQSNNANTSANNAKGDTSIGAKNVGNNKVYDLHFDKSAAPGDGGLLGLDGLIGITAPVSAANGITVPIESGNTDQDAKSKDNTIKQGNSRKMLTYSQPKPQPSRTTTVTKNSSKTQKNDANSSANNSAGDTSIGASNTGNNVVTKRVDCSKAPAATPEPTTPAPRKKRALQGTITGGLGVDDTLGTIFAGLGGLTGGLTDGQLASICGPLVDVTAPVSALNGATIPVDSGNTDQSAKSRGNKISQKNH